MKYLRLPVLNVHLFICNGFSRFPRFPTKSHKNANVLNTISMLGIVFITFNANNVIYGRMKFFLKKSY